MAPVLVPLRPSSEHILIVRAPGARDQHGCHSTPFIVRVPGAKGCPGCETAPTARRLSHRSELRALFAPARGVRKASAGTRPGGSRRLGQTPDGPDTPTCR